MASDSDASDLFERFWSWRMKDSPEFASYCGVHDYDDRWDDISAEAYLKREEAVRGFLSEAEGLDKTSCSKTAKDSLTILTQDLKTYLSGAGCKSYLFPVNYMEGIHNELHHLIGYHEFTSVDGYQKYMKRLTLLPQRILQIIPLLQQGIEDGIVLHKYSVDGVAKQLDSMIMEQTQDSFLFEPFNKSDCCLPDDLRESMKREAVDEFTANIKPSIEKLRHFIESEYMSHTRASEGISALKDGEEFYQKCLSFHLSCEMSPQEVHDIGLKEVARIREQMLDIAKQEGFENDLKGFQKVLHTSEKFGFKTADDVMDYVKDICFNQIRPQLTRVFHQHTGVSLVLKPTPASQANSPGGYYMAGTADNSRPGVYYINGNRLDACKKYEYMALSLHEGEPGHHYQLSNSISKSVPGFRQFIEDAKYYLPPGRFPLHTAYMEGWGLYAEALGMELGLYKDNYSLFGRYSFEMWRAARLVVDTGIHAFGWTQDKAVQYLVDNTLRNEWSMKNEVNRYITWPGQACAYKIGELKLWELRHKAEKELGDLFDVRDYHAAVLKCGPCPLTFLENEIGGYIHETKGRQN